MMPSKLQTVSRIYDNSRRNVQSEKQCDTEINKTTTTSLALEMTNRRKYNLNEVSSTSK
jgi:hypothetical protein